ncbi:TfoX/Sxy family protein [Mucilaginibacter sp. NFX135]|uniref:TfoX/Sxy family protein n=1 Tax=Mucilaginibacter sp. NFX135 TaxID=3402687 RepID=UPI003AFB56AF
MAYDELLANRIRQTLSEQERVDEVKMFQGLCFMVNDKMCVCIRDKDMLCRIGNEQALIALENDNCRQMIMGSRVMKDFVFVEAENLRSAKDLDHWIGLCLQFNKVAKPSKKRKK